MLVLGAGINGCALARELLLGGVHVWLVDQADIAFGTTAYSSRLIHGGLRYLEYGEFDLVRESLAERTRLLRLAPQFVRPLRLFIPVDNRFGGLLAAPLKFLGWSKGDGHAARRGAWLVRLGLWFYDTYARDPALPRRAVHRRDEPGVVAVDRRFRWLLSYYDAQCLYPERFTLALVEDARQIARQRNLDFQVRTYHQARLEGQRVVLRPGAAAANSAAGSQPGEQRRFDAIVNATGAWVDLTLASLGVRSRQLIGGTKGSHLVTHKQSLREALGPGGIYAEASDGRPVFILPFGSATLIGTTDEHYRGDPALAVASQAEIDYLLATVNDIVPQAALGRDDIDLSYCGVRPLPYVPQGSTAAITRRHALVEVPGAGVPFYAIVGGKLTTCRSLAEESTATILRRLGRTPVDHSRQRPLPGAEDYPADEIGLHARLQAVAARHRFGDDQVRAMWLLCGTRVEPILQSLPAVTAENLPGTPLPLCFVRWVVQNEWVQTLDDLIERRLMLLFTPGLSVDCLRRLAELLVAEGKLAPHQLDQSVAATIDRLQCHFGKRLATTSPGPTAMPATAKGDQ